MNWARAVTAAEKLIVFSTSSAVIVDEVFPDAAGKIAIVPHSLLQTVPCLPRPKGTKRVVGVLGAIGPQKGAAVVAALAKALEHEPDMGLALIGRIAPGYPLGEKVPIHGTYVIEDIPVLAARYGVTHWLIPSIWPETFSYTAHECLATGLPTLAFDLGAQGEAVAKAVNGYVLPWASGARKPEQLVKLILTALRRV
jgi:glycosyltransferase involved in cell wall biosynthesis